MQKKISSDIISNVSTKSKDFHSRENTTDNEDLHTPPSVAVNYYYIGTGK